MEGFAVKTKAKTVLEHMRDGQFYRINDLMAKTGMTCRAVETGIQGGRTAGTVLSMRLPYANGEATFYQITPLGLARLAPNPNQIQKRAPKEKPNEAMVRNTVRGTANSVFSLGSFQGAMQ